jgi:uncharacterized membrane protein
VRTSVLLLAGFGAVSAAVAVPSLRERVLRLVGGVKDKVGSAAPSTSPTTITEEIEVDAPLSTVYNQWTQFEEFPQFMEGVESVQQIDDTHLLWTAEIGGKTEEWRAEITEQHPDHRVAWKATEGRDNAGVVTFHQIDENTTRVAVQMDWDPDGIIEATGSALGADSRRVKGDLERFKELIESRGAETGAWRGEVENSADRNA